MVPPGPEVGSHGLFMLRYVKIGEDGNGDGVSLHLDR